MLRKNWLLDAVHLFHSGEKIFNVKTSQFASFGAEWDWDPDRKLKAGRSLNPLPYHSPSRSWAGAAVGLASGTCQFCSRGEAPKWPALSRMDPLLPQPVAAGE